MPSQMTGFARPAAAMVTSRLIDLLLLDFDQMNTQLGRRREALSNISLFFTGFVHANTMYHFILLLSSLFYFSLCICVRAFVIRIFFFHSGIQRVQMHRVESRRLPLPLPFKICFSLPWPMDRLIVFLSPAYKSTNRLLL